MPITIESITASKILELVEQFLSESEQKWLNTKIGNLLQAPSLSLMQKQNLIDDLCGSWAEDNTIPSIFAEIEQQRALSESRKVDTLHLT